MRKLLIIAPLLILISCSQESDTKPLKMQLIRTSYSKGADWGVISNPGSLVIAITSGKATGELLYIRDGASTVLETFEFDTVNHPYLASTPVLDGSPDAVDLSFVRNLDPGAQRPGDAKVSLTGVARVSRAGGGQSIVEGPNVLYRIQRTTEDQDRWRLDTEITIQNMIEISNSLDCEYIVLDLEVGR